MNLAFNAFAIFNVGLTQFNDKKMASLLLIDLNAPFSLKELNPFNTSSATSITIIYNLYPTVVYFLYFQLNRLL